MASEEERVLNELRQLKQSFKDNFNNEDIDVSEVEFRNYPQVVSEQMEKKLIEQTKSVIPTKSPQNVSPDEGYKLTEVEVGAIPDNYIEPNGTLPVTENGIKDVTQYKSIDVNVEGIKPTGTLNITENDTYDVTNYAGANVNVQPKLQEKTATPTKESQVVTPDTGFDGIDKMNINPIPEEYIIPEGTLEITQNDTYDVTEYKTVTTNIAGSGDCVIAQRTVNEYDINFSEGDVVLTSNYTEGGVLDFRNLEINGDLRFNEDEGYLYLPSVTGSSVYGEVHFYMPFDGTITVSCFMNKYPDYSTTTSGGFILSNLDVSVKGLNYNVTSDKGSFYSETYYNNRNFSKTFDITKGYHFISFTNYGPHSEQIPSVNILEIKQTENVVIADGLSKVTLKKPNDLNSKAILEGNQIWGIKGEAYGMTALLDGTATQIEDNTTKIADYACYRKSSIASINFPECSYIGEYAFAQCSALTQMSLPKVLRIERDAFYSCYKLEEVNLPLCSSIAWYAFHYCTSLKTINIPECTYIGHQCFYSCRNIQEINAPKLKTIMNSAFYGLGISGSLTFPELEGIGACAFQTASLNEFNGPKVKNIGSSAFYSCSNLETINFPEVSTITGPYVFGGTKISEFSFPMLQRIDGSSAFANMALLTKVSFPELTSIGSSAFYNCSNLTECYAPKVTTISQNAFYGCKSLASADFPEVKTISNSAFTNCVLLSSLNFPELTHLGGSAFYGCIALSSINIPKVSAIYSGTFSNCSLITELYLPSATLISQYAFYGNVNLSKIEVPILPSVGNRAFIMANGLLSITLPMASTISGSAFWQCFKLSYVDLPVCVSLMSTSIFNACSALETLIIRTPSCALSNVNAFTNTPMSNSTYLSRWGSIYVPAENVDWYKTATNWVTYSDRITSIENLPTT